MALIRHLKLDDNAASTTVVATVGSNATSQRNTSLMAVGAGNGPGGSLDDAGLSFSRASTDYITGNNPSLSNNGSLACWFKTSDTTYTKAFIDIRDGSGDGALLVWNTAIPGLQGARNPDSVSTTTDFADGEWHHALFAWTNTNLYLYVDGSSVASAGPLGTQTVSVTANYRIGARSYSGTDIGMEGALADIRIYDTNESANVASIMADAKPSASATISGTESVGSTLTASPSSNDSTASWTYQWYRDADGVGAGSAISGATSSTYVLQEADEDQYIRVGVIATNTGGAGLVSDEAFSAYSGQIAANSTPVISSVTLSGTSQIGSTLTATVATTPDPVDSIAYQWQKAATDDAEPGTDISGETSQTLALTYADFGSLLDTAAYVRCGAIATKNSLDSDEAFSAWQAVTVPSGAGLTGSPLKSPFLIA